MDSQDTKKNKLPHFTDILLDITTVVHDKTNYLLGLSVEEEIKNIYSLIMFFSFIYEWDRAKKSRPILKIIQIIGLTW